MSSLLDALTPRKRKREPDGDMAEDSPAKRFMKELVLWPRRLITRKSSTRAVEKLNVDAPHTQTDSVHHTSPKTTQKAPRHKYEIPGSFPDPTGSSSDQEVYGRHAASKAQHHSSAEVRRAGGDRNQSQYWRGVGTEISTQKSDKNNVASTLEPALQNLGRPPPFARLQRKVPIRSRPLHQAHRPIGSLQTHDTRQQPAFTLAIDAPSASRKREKVTAKEDDVNTQKIEEQIRQYYIENESEGFESLSGNLTRSQKLSAKGRKLQAARKEWDPDFFNHLKEAGQEFLRKKEEDAARKLRPKTPEKPRPLVYPLASDVLNSLPNLAKIDGSQQLGMFGRTPVTARDLLTLRNGVWLNDEIINSWLWELCDKAKAILTEEMQARDMPIKDDIPRYHAFNTQWYPTMKAADWRNKVPRWAKRAKIDGINLLKVHKVLIPIHHGAHWTLLVILPQRRTVRYYDSLAGSAENYLQAATDWIAHELGDRWAESEWRMEQADSGQQVNMSDCGVFLSLNALATFYTDALPEVLPTGELSNGRDLMKYVLLKGGFKDDYDLQKLHPSFRLEEDRQVNGEVRKVGREVVKAN